MPQKMLVQLQPLPIFFKSALKKLESVFFKKKTFFLEKKILIILDSYKSEKGVNAFIFYKQNGPWCNRVAHLVWDRTVRVQISLVRFKFFK